MKMSVMKNIIYDELLIKIIEEKEEVKESLKEFQKILLLKYLFE